MTVIANIERDEVEPAIGRRRIYVRYRHVETGTDHYNGVQFLPIGADAQAAADALAAGIDQQLRASELESFASVAERHAIDPRTRPAPQYVTMAQVTRYLVRRLFNLARRADSTGDESLNRLKKLAAAIAHVTPTQVANATGLTLAQANAAMTRLQNFITAANALDHGHGELDE